MIRHDDENNVGSGVCYTLYLEYLGGLVPLLKGKKTSKIRPEFVIFDPQVSSKLKKKGKNYGLVINHSFNCFVLQPIISFINTQRVDLKQQIVQKWVA